jgi:hypothetical protein
MSNLDLWDKLGKTDPEHTKSFTRGGGFKGTAVKPIYTDHKMTEQFGPCGIGWGITEPRYEVVPASEGQVAVYCWLSIWYMQDGNRSDPVPGVGGDMVVIKQQSGLRTNDEAFKAAATDAISNAMKHIGMSADVHMGRFDDHKYVREVREELAAAAPAPKQAKPAVPTTPLPDGIEAKAVADRPEVAEYLRKVSSLLDTCDTGEEIDSVLKAGAAQRKSIGLVEGSPSWSAFKSIVSLARQAIEEGAAA